MRRAGLICLCCSLATAFMAVAEEPQQGSSGTNESSVQLADAPGRALTASQCQICHSLDYITMNSPVMDRATWQKTIQKMRERFGAPLSDEEAAQILDYLSEHYAGRQ